MKSEAKAHLDAVNESYWQHFKHASGFAFRMWAGGFACMLHAINPGWCATTGSSAINRLHQSMVVNRTGSVGE